MNKSNMSYAADFGGNDNLKSKEEILDMLAINKILLRSCHGNISRVPKAVKKLMDSSKLTDNQNKILRGAI